jgi:hypothetical protein
MSEHTPFNWMEHLGFEVQEADGVPVINEDGDMREADLCHRVLWDEVVALTTERDSLRAVNAELLEALEGLLNRDELNTCQHEETYRGGAIWEICRQCDSKWADDKGGKPKWKDPAEWVAAYAAIASARKQGEQG